MKSEPSVTPAPISVSMWLTEIKQFSSSFNRVAQETGFWGHVSQKTRASLRRVSVSPLLCRLPHASILPPLAMMPDQVTHPYAHTLAKPINLTRLH